MPDSAGRLSSKKADVKCCACGGPVRGEALGVRRWGIGTSMTRASSTDCPPGKYASRVRAMCSSGPKLRSCRWGSRGMILRAKSGASNWRPSELAYFLKIMSRTSSTKSSSLIVTMVADPPGRLTQILRVTMVAPNGNNCSLAAARSRSSA